VVVYVGLLPFLPTTPVTQTSIQASTAQAAYLKNIAFYFLPLATAFLLLPFHTIAVLSRESRLGNCQKILDTFSLPNRLVSNFGLFISTRTLGLILLAAGITSLILTYRLLDNLKSGPYLNRFSILVIVRVLLYFGFGAECLAWYSLKLSDIRLSCEKAIQSRL
jgi:hypothetical protein